MKTLVVIDMQNDFITGPLGTEEARAIVPNVKKKIEEYRATKDLVIFTRDTHLADYLDTNEGKHLPIKHCIYGSDGWKIESSLNAKYSDMVDKPNFGYIAWRREGLIGDIEIIGLCTDICVVSNALILKATYPEVNVTVDANCCAGTTPENHRMALAVMKSCQINVINE
jgi:nicotinamidase-related amidase